MASHGEARDRDGSRVEGSSTEQHVTGAPETGEFPVDEEPAATTPAHGSSNAGINATGGNRPERAADDV
ncbi:hypothetical protein [Actinoplanes sp. DH11]|uniref:hypothetical protein n=1 Tax=Actinoplanes sp. DH11 TaxID=2857011 RepID=UPI001E424D5C|nr:hypothetical protein [Actinoplanes sp. DH11]